jgi:hypothetical protein
MSLSLWIYVLIRTRIFAAAEVAYKTKICGIRSESNIKVNAKAVDPRRLERTVSKIGCVLRGVAESKESPAAIGIIKAVIVDSFFVSSERSGRRHGRLTCEDRGRPRENPYFVALYLWRHVLIGSRVFGVPKMNDKSQVLCVIS